VSGSRGITADTVTILTTASRRLVATKRIWLRPDRTFDIKEYDNPKYFEAFERRVDGLEALAALLSKVERHPRAMVIRGQILATADPKRTRRLRYAQNGEDGEPCFEEVPRQWLLLDFDTIACDFDPCSDPEACVRRCVALLPSEFYGVSCWWQFTGGAGIKPGLRMRLGYWLDRPLGERDLKRWLPGKPVDQSVLSPVQPIYVAWPIFEEGEDPVPVRSGIFRAGRDTVAVPSILEPAGEDDDSPRLGYAAWCGLIGDHSGGKGFHDPTKKAIAAWVGKHGAKHPTTWLRKDIERVIRNADRSGHSDEYIDSKVEELDGLIAWTVEREASKPPKQGQGSETAAIAAETELFHTPDGDAFVDIEVRGHRESHRVRSKAFKQWISFSYYSEHGKPPASEALEQALVLTEGKARFDASERDAHLRVACVEEKIYLDLADDRWRAVEIDRRGWRVIDRSPVRFRRTESMQPLPAPQKGGSIDDLKPFLNVNDDGFKLVVAWQVSALGGRGPYPILAPYGEHGAAKTSTGRFARRSFDPSRLPSRAPPRSDRDLYVAANNSYALHFENISKIPDWLSDTFCRLATGGGFATRTLYVDSDETVFHGMRPLILDGIDNFIERADLADRSMKLELVPITGKQRRPEKELDNAFAAKHPLILGALLDAVSHGLGELSVTKLAELPRMADFALWIAACEGALWKQGEFERIYNENRGAMLVDVGEANIVCHAIRDFFGSKMWNGWDEKKKDEHWIGTADELLKFLVDRADLKTTLSPAWPKNARALSQQMRRIRTALLAGGIEVITGDKAHDRTIQLWPVADAALAADIEPADIEPADIEPADIEVPDQPYY
jgi:hypothetical protein